MSDLPVRVAVLETKTDQHAEQLRESVKQAEFWPVKTLVLGFVAMTLIAVIGAILKLAGLG